MSSFHRLLAVVAISGFLAGCGQGETPSPEAADPPSPEQPAQSGPASPTPPAIGPLTPGETVEPESPATTQPAEAPSQVISSEPVAADAPPVRTVAAVPAAFARCQACHSVAPGAPHKVGPNLAGVMGSVMGTRPGYEYSEAMAESGEVWTRERMDAFLASPRDVAPGTKMMAPPVRDAEDRQALIDYLASLS